MEQDIQSLKLPTFLIQALKKLGYVKYTDININDKNIRRLISGEECSNAIRVPIHHTALDMYEEEYLYGNILTFNKQFDEALDGGLAVGQITEFCGEPGSGRTQTCFQLSVNIQFPVWCGGADGEVLYICSNSNFSSTRINEIASRAVEKYKGLKNLGVPLKNFDKDEMSVDKIMNQIHYLRITDLMELYALVTYLHEWLNLHKKIRLVIIDSITVPFQEIEGIEKNQPIYRILSDLQSLAKKYKFAIVVTNDMTTQFIQDKKSIHTPSLGGSYYHRINKRVELKKLTEDTYQATVIKSVQKPEDTIIFKLY